MTEHLIFLDTETTGLNPARHEVWEIAYAVDRGPITSMVVTHTLATADPQSLDLNGYWNRSGNTGIGYHERFAWEQQLKDALRGNTLVCSNPIFDTSFLLARWGEAPWHYATVDIKSYAMGAMQVDRPPKLQQIAEYLGVTIPDHTAAQDVAVLRECYYLLADEYKELHI